MSLQIRYDLNVNRFIVRDDFNNVAKIQLYRIEKFHARYNSGRAPDRRYQISWTGFDVEQFLYVGEDEIEAAKELLRTACDRNEITPLYG